MLLLSFRRKKCVHYNPVNTGLQRTYLFPIDSNRLFFCRHDTNDPSSPRARILFLLSYAHSSHIRFSDGLQILYNSRDIPSPSRQLCYYLLRFFWRRSGVSSLFSSFQFFETFSFPHSDLLIIFTERGL